MTIDEIILRDQQRRVQAVNRGLWLTAALLAGMALGLCAGSGCASDLDDAETQAADVAALQVWTNTWGHTLGAPPKVVVDDGNDPRCPDPHSIWFEGACTGGGFMSDEFTIYLPKEWEGSIAHELAHAASKRLGGVFERWSLAHADGYYEQVCRAEFQYTQVLGRAVVGGDCAPAAVVEREQEEELP
jgi:hypothetical protein